MLGAPGLDFETWDIKMIQERIHAVRDLAGKCVAAPGYLHLLMRITRSSH